MATKNVRFLCIVWLCIAPAQLFSQQDSVSTDTISRPMDPNQMAPILDSLMNDSSETPEVVLPTAIDTVKKGYIRRLLFPGKRPPYDPKIAWQRSAIFPGWGQIYNKRIWKLPFVYGAYVGTGIVLVFYQDQYTTFRQAFQAVADDDPNTVPNDPRLAEISQENLKNTRDRARRQRDYWIIYTAGVHLLQVVEAYVDAHLRDFDISEDLTFKVEPSFTNPMNSGIGHGAFMPGAGFSIRW